MTPQEQISYFKAKQEEIMRLSVEFEKKRHEIETRANAELESAQFPLRDAGEKYRAEMKAVFGVTDGERINVLDVVELIDKVSNPKPQLIT